MKSITKHNEGSNIISKVSALSGKTNKQTNTTVTTQNPVSYTEYQPFIKAGDLPPKHKARKSKGLFFL